MRFVRQIVTEINQGQLVVTFWISLKITCITKAKRNQEEIVKRENIKIVKAGSAYRANLTSFRSQTNDLEKAFFRITGYTTGSSAIFENFHNRCRKGYALKRGKCRRKPNPNFDPSRFFGFA